VRTTEELSAQLKSEAIKSGLELNANNTKYMRVMRNLTLGRI
jgi:hypothetical protein